MSHGKTILSTQNLAVGYRKKAATLEVLTDINVEMQAGQLICFMGPNGVGKSTLIRTMCGTQPALQGSVQIFDKAIQTYSNNELSRLISTVFTDRINVGNMSVRELISYGRYPYTGWTISFSKKDRTKINEAIELTDTSYIADKSIHELSDGQLQKAMIARALCQDTPIMILDEPTAHLDLNNRVEVINLLHDLSRQTGKSILMATHELDLALQAADRIWLAGHDQPMIEGFPEDLVLNDSFDRVFGLKGYDLKTGTLKKKVGHHRVQLLGEGYQYLWTKNALERNGFLIDSSSETLVTFDNNSELSWTIKNKGTHQVDTLETLITKLNSLIPH